MRKRTTNEIRGLDTPLLNVANLSNNHPTAILMASADAYIAASQSQSKSFTSTLFSYGKKGIQRFERAFAWVKQDPENEVKSLLILRALLTGYKTQNTIIQKAKAAGLILETDIANPESVLADTLERRIRELCPSIISIKKITDEIKTQLECDKKDFCVGFKDAWIPADTATNTPSQSRK